MKMNTDTEILALPDPRPTCDWLCQTHNREATAQREDGTRHCEGSGIAAPCQVVWNGTGPAPLPYDAEFINTNWEKIAPFFSMGGVLLMTQDGHWVYGNAFTIASALVEAGAQPTTQCKVFIVVGDDAPRVNAQGHISIRKPAQIYQAAQVELSALLPAGFTGRQIVTPERKLIIPG